MASPNVSVVIPTTGRPCLAEAIASAKAQCGAGEIEVIVVVDRPQESLSDASGKILEGASKVLYTGGSGRAGHARNMGIAAARGEWVALLDDDDTWEPGKLANQLKAAMRDPDPGSLVISSRVRQGVRSTGRLSPPIPATVYEGGRVEDYLFRSRRPSIQRAVIYTSTLFLSRERARKVAWDAQLPRHQDWDWLCRLQDETGARFFQLASADVSIWSESEGSLSASTDWESSLEWVRRFKGRWNPRTYADFVAAQPLRYAMAGRSLKGIRASVGEIRRSGALPAIGPIVIGLGGMVSRGLALRMLTHHGPARQATEVAE
ncbi:glycosyltransferase family 2 protein [Mycolicibacterium phlei]|uniref:glycosyltransferase family 2 protein n=1 Tax=Mycolicibacterium phlei TaxID=1771 RepID=UPI00025AEDFA|nr:glycosyl transferase family protein [Mycolicibacterium phlei RIVM601174]MBF4191226.1 glycosyl transferase family protein [Mycolicibacterium phlei]